MAAKLKAVPLPESLEGKRVLDVGCDFGFWCFEADVRGSETVVGIDRNREVRGIETDLIELNRLTAEQRGANCWFEKINLGKQWPHLEHFDLILCLSVYHHIYENCGDHSAVWFWLWRQCTRDAVLLWEGPVDDTDPVVRANVSDNHRKEYHRAAILAAAQKYFEAEYIGPALHEPTREVWRFRPKKTWQRTFAAEMISGAGGATPAFEYSDGRRIKEIEFILGEKSVAGSFNLRLTENFDYEQGYFRAQVLDVCERGKGLDVKWDPRWARFYPVTVDGIPAHAFRFEGEKYRQNFVELIAPVRLRDNINGTSVTLCH